LEKNLGKFVMKFLIVSGGAYFDKLSINFSSKVQSILSKKTPKFPMIWWAQQPTLYSKFGYKKASVQFTEAFNSGQ
jgi:hypothetical protein